MDRHIDAAYRACARLTRREAKNFYYGFMTLPRKERLAIYAVYAFCRQADDIADGAGSVKEKESALADLGERLRAAAYNRPLHPMDVALHDALQRYPIEMDDLLDVLSGVRMDLSVSRYETFDALRDYCYQVASAVGLTVLPILAYGRGDSIPQTAREHAVDLGLGLQLANIVRDVAEDGARDRIYLPQEDLARFRVSPQELLSGTMNEDVRRLLAFQVSRAREYIARGRSLFPFLPARSRSCPQLLAAVYSEILSKIEGRNYDVFSERVSLSAVRKLALTARVLMGGAG